MAETCYVAVVCMAVIVSITLDLLKKVMKR